MAGRPKRVFSEEQIKEIDRLALINCKTNTIAVALDIPFKTLERHFAKRLKAGRALWKVNLRENQDSISKTSADMCKFLGKNELGQVDKQTIAQDPPDSKPKTAKDLRAAQAAAKAYNAEMARGDDRPTIVPITGQKGA